MIDDDKKEDEFNFDIFESIHELFRRRRRQDMKNKNISMVFGGGGQALSPEFTAWRDRLTTLGYTKPSAAQQIKINTLFAGLSLDGNLSLMDIAYLFLQDGSKEAAKVNLITPASFEIAADIGTVNWASNDGMTGDGTTGALNTTWNASTNGVNFTRNSNCFFVWVMDTAIQASKMAMGCNLIETTGQGWMVNPRNTGDVVRSNNHNATTTSTAGATTAAGLISVVRTSSTEYQIYKNGVAFGSPIAQTSNAIVNLVCYICAIRQTTNPGLFYGNTIAFAGAGSGAINQLALYNRLNTFISNP